MSDQQIASNKTPSTSDDWLKFDPLGFDMMDDELDDELSDDPMLESQTLESDILDSHIPKNSAGDRNHVDDMVNKKNIIEANYYQNNTSKPTNNTAIPEAQTIMTDTTIDANMPNINTEIEAGIDTEIPKFDGDTSRANPHFKALLPQPINRHESDRQLIMDTETTGLDPLKGDRIVEVGIVEMIGRKFTGEKLHVYINPQRGMDEEVIRIHGISEAFLSDKPTFNQVAQSLYDFMDGAEVIAHNATFDMNFLNMEFAKVGMHDFAERVKVTDSLVMAKQQYPGQKNTLDALVRRLDVGKQDRTFHGALLDSEILAEVYLAMTGGQVTLAIEEDTQADGGQTAHASFASLANLLLESSINESANQIWYAALAEDYPELKAKM